MINGPRPNVVSMHFGRSVWGFIHLLWKPLQIAPFLF